MDGRQHLIFSFRALQSLEKAVLLQNEVLDTHDELIHTHQTMSIVFQGLGKREGSREGNGTSWGVCEKTGFRGSAFGNLPDQRRNGMGRV